MAAKRGFASFCLVLLMGVGAARSAPASQKQDLRLLTRVGMIHELEAGEAERRYPIRFRAVVTYTDTRQDMLFVEDETGGVYVDLTPPYHFQLRSGQVVEVEGFTGPGYFAPMVVEPKIKVIGTGVLPEPSRVSIQMLFAGGEDCQWVETRGVVRSISATAGILQMTLAEGNAKIEVQISDFDKVPALIDSLVTVRGVAGGVFNDKGQMIGAQLYVPGLEEIHVDEHGPADPYAIPLRPIQRILQFVPVRGYGHRVRILGTVTFWRPGASLFVRDDSAGIYVSSGLSDPIRPGDTVEVIGFPEVGDYTPVLRDATYRRIGAGEVPQAVRILPELAIKGAYDTELVEIEGRLVSSGYVMGEQVYVLQSGYQTFNAHLSEANGAGPAITPGGLLRLTGICSVQADELRRPVSFRILLRTPGDISVLERPSWWTLSHALVVVGILLGVVFAVLTWVFVLDRRIKVQTAMIRQRLEREAALEHRLQQAQKMEAIGRLAGGIAHDFNNLLTAILGYTELIAIQVSSDHPAAAELGEIRKAGERASSLTRQLLAFSRRQVMQPKVIILNTVIQDMSRMLTRLIGEHIELVSVLDPHLGSVKADPSQIEQVLMNLSVNARDAMPGGGRLTIETCNAELSPSDTHGRGELQPGSYVRLAVTDTGCGMDETTLKNIFEPFFTTKGLGHGTGLGLATVYGIVKQSGGDILVDSEVGRGTTFVTYLPRVQAEAESEPVPDTEAAARGRETILVVEDEPALRTLIRVILTRHGYTVIEAPNGEEAFAMAAKCTERIDLLATDVIMPKMGGIELAERLVPLRPEMGLLFLSGYTDDAITNRNVFKEGTPFLQKPFTPDALARKVRETLDAHIAELAHFQV
jgi:two-component system, cell cycle sensor histidine kinase and response regulator CckA